MRIAYVAIKGIQVGGGIENLTEEIGSRLVQKGHEIVIYSSRDYGTVDGFYKGMEIKTVSSLNTKSFHKLSICFNAIRDILRQNNVDLVHVHAVGPSLFSIFPRLKRISTIVQTHGIEWKRDKWGFIGKTFFKLADFTAIYFPHKTTCVSKIQKSYFEDKFGREIIYIPPGVRVVPKRKPEWLYELGLEPNRYILFASRLVKEKGAHYLIDAFRSIHTEFKLVITGDAAHEERYKNYLKQKAGEDSRIIFTGFVLREQLDELFSNAYLFCLPSTLEGLPGVLLEAMSFGNCCVASDIPENVEAIEEYGYTFRNRDFKDLGRTLADLIEHPDKVDEKKEAARRYVLQNYTWEQIADQMEAFYSKLING